jgi:hypothetical protein
VTRYEAAKKLARLAAAQIDSYNGPGHVTAGTLHLQTVRRALKEWPELLKLVEEAQQRNRLREP